MIASLVATAGAFVYGWQIWVGVSDQRLLTAGLVMLAVGALWYAAVRLWALIRRERR